MLEDEDNSALGIICAELETQGLSVCVNGVAVTAVGIFEGEFEELEQKIELHFVLHKDGTTVEKFAIRFTEYHEFEVM